MQIPAIAVISRIEKGKGCFKKVVKSSRCV